MSSFPRIAVPGIALLLIATTGCDVKQPELYPDQPSAPTVAQPVAEKPTMPVVENGFPEAATGEPVSATVETPQTTEEKKNDGELVKADVGVGRKGRNYGGEKDGIMAPITTPVATYFAAKGQIAFRIQVPDAMRLYKASSADGKGPSDHETFMRDIIQANGIKLPELKPGDEYEYDPEKEELMVRKAGVPAR